MKLIGDELGSFRALADQLAGQFPKSRPGEREGEGEANSEAEGMEALLRDRGVPRKLARQVSRVEGHKPQATKALEAALGWWASLRDRRDVLVLSGDRGRGKSYAAAQIMAQSKPGSFAWWMNARSLADVLHTREQRKSATVLERVRTCRVLVLDDLGWEHADKSGYVLSAFIGLLDDRIQDELRTVVTTNLNEAKFRSRYGEAMHDRIRGYGVWCDVPEGRSMR